MREKGRILENIGEMGGKRVEGRCGAHSFLFLKTISTLDRGETVQVRW